jgi:hypothetical protein
VFEGPLRLLSRFAVLAVLLGFGLFAVDELRGASDATRAELRGDEPEAVRDARHGPLREAVDDVNDVLLAPFEVVAQDLPSAWAQRGVPALLALAVFGFGLGTLARYARGTS